MYIKQTQLADKIQIDQIHEGRGSIKRRPLFKEHSRLPVKFEVWEFEAGVSEGDHIHEGVDSLEEVYYILTGEGMMTMDGDQISVSSGDAIMVAPGVDHGVFNPGPQTMRLLIIWGAPSGEYMDEG